MTHVMANITGTIVGRVRSIETGVPSDSSYDAGEDRTLSAIEITVVEIADGTPPPNSAGPMPALAPGSAATLMMYEDTRADSVEPAQALADRNGLAAFHVVSAVDPHPSGSEGRWIVERIVSLEGDAPRFEGGCEDLNQTFTALARLLDRPADVELLLDYTAEILEGYDKYVPAGPIGQAAVEAELEAQGS